MSARGDNCPVQVLRSPVPRPRDPSVVDFGFDSATVPSVNLTVPTPLRSFSLPPSPPYTNSHLRRVIPLPGMDDFACRKQPYSMELEKDDGRRTLSTFHAPPNLLSPPYSPHRRTLLLPPLVEREESIFSPSDTSSSTESHEQKWMGCDDDHDESEPPILKLRDLDLGEESDDWDEPLFLNAPPALNDADSLSLNLFGAVCSSDDEEGASFQPMVPPSSPTMRSLSPPDLDGDLPEKSKPLFDPSDFDVFENGWDTINTNTPMSMQEEWSGNGETSRRFCGVVESLSIPAPSSPSRRSVIELPADDTSDPLMSGSFERPRLVISDEFDDPSVRDDQLFGHTRFCQNIPRRSHKHDSIDVSADLIQTPFNLPLLLSSSSLRSPPAGSVLFAGVEAQDIPLPDSPESSLSWLDGEYVIPPHLLEQYRLRKLHQELARVESEARTREARLTEYIARLNAMEPPSLPVPVPVYSAGNRDGASGSAAANAEPFRSESSPLQEQGLSPAASVSYTESFVSQQAAADLEFMQYRRKEVRNAVALRAAERRRRKATKERMRELEALLQLKTGQFQLSDAWSCRGRRRRNEEPIVLFAAGSDRHSMHSNAMLLDGMSGPEAMQKEDIMQLVAKMVLRRRDTSRPLSGKTVPLVREYTRSRLSRSAFVENGEYEEDSSDESNTPVS